MKSYLVFIPRFHFFLSQSDRCNSQQCPVLHLNSGKDYRFGGKKDLQTYFYPLNESNEKEVNDLFRQVAAGDDYKSGEDGEFVPREDDIQYQVYEWLSIEYLANSTELKIIAEPNASGKSRKLHIELHSGPEYHVVEVKQE